MSNTSVKPRLSDWLPCLLSGHPHQIIGGADNPYLLRWYVIPRNPLVNVYLHKFMRSDDDRALHDHPWWFVSLMLRGQYDEITEQGVRRRESSPRFAWGAACAVAGILLTRRNRRAGGLLFVGALVDIFEAAQRTGTVAFRPAEWRHRVQLLKARQRVDTRMPGVKAWTTREVPCWTLIVTGRRVRTWGFWCREARITGSDSAGVTGKVTEHFVPWTDFGDAGCGEV